MSAKSKTKDTNTAPSEPIYKLPVQKSSFFGKQNFNPQFGRGHGFAKTSFKTQHKGG